VETIWFKNEDLVESIYYGDPSLNLKSSEKNLDNLFTHQMKTCSNFPSELNQEVVPK
jgi:hypothetical protein